MSNEFSAIAPGLHRDISKGDYTSDLLCAVPTLNVSTAKLIVGRSVAHAWAAHPKGGKFSRESTDAQNNGTLLDSLLLGGDTEFVTLPEMLPDAKGKMMPTNDKALLDSAKRWKAEQIAAGRMPVSQTDLRFARIAADAIRENLARDGVTLDGENRVTAVWDDDHGVRCRARYDHLKLDQATIYDLKIVDCAHPRAVARKMIDYGWDLQSVAYPRALEIVRPELAGRVRFVFLFCESEPPYEVLVRPSAGTMRALGTWKWERALRLWAEALKTRKFAGYSGAENGIEAPTYAMADMDEGLAGGSSGVAF